MLGLFVAQWANACPSTELEARCEAEAERAWFASCGISETSATDAEAERCFASLDADAAYESAYRSCETFAAAQADVVAAPSWCAVTYVERTPAGWRAVCALEVSP